MKKVLGIILTVIMLFSMAPMAMAKESGTLYTGVKWEFSAGVLQLSGSGYILTNDIYFPWEEFKSEIEEIIVGDSIEAIGEWAFDGCENLTTVTVGSSMESIGQYAFYGCENLSKVIYKNTRGISAGKGNGMFTMADAYTVRGKTQLTPVCGYDRDGNLELTLDETGTLTITGTGPMRKTVLTSNLGSYIKRVVIEDGLTSLCDDAFEGCDAITEVILPYTLEEMGQRAFAFCSSLESIYLPDSYVMSDYSELAGSVFLDCRNLKEYDVSNSNPNYVAIDGVLYSKDKTILVAYPAGAERKKFIIPSHVTEIGAGAFCPETLEELIIPEGVKSIESNGVRGDYKAIYVPKSLSYISSRMDFRLFNAYDIYYASSEEDWKELMGTKKYGNYDGTTTVHFNVSWQDRISVTLNGDEIKFDQKPVIENGRTLVPLRAIFEALGATVDWDNDTRTVTSVKGKTKVTLTVGESAFYVNGKEVKLDVPAKIVNNRTLVPARAVAESFGCKVDWDNDTRTVIITK